MTMTVVDRPQLEDGPTERVLDSFFVAPLRASEMDSIKIETTLEVGATLLRQHEVTPRQGEGPLIARWVTDPRGQQSRICIWAR